jgi:hypothetical protein
MGLHHRHRRTALYISVVIIYRKYTGMGEIVFSAAWLAVPLVVGDPLVHVDTEAAPVVVSVPTVGGELQQNLAALAGLRLITRAARSH